MRNLTGLSVSDTLKAARGSEEILARLESASISGKTGKISEALRDAGFIGGPEDVKAVFGDIRYVLAKGTDGRTFRFPVTESGENIRLGKPEILDLGESVKTVAEQIVVQAEDAAQALLEGNGESALTLIRSIAGHLDVKGEVARKVNMELDVATIAGPRWYETVVEQISLDDVELPIVLEGAEHELPGAFAQLKTILESEYRTVLALLDRVKESKADPSVLDAVRSVVEDTTCALRALSSVRGDDGEREQLNVYRALVKQAPVLIRGMRFAGVLTQGVEGVAAP